MFGEVESRVLHGRAEDVSGFEGFGTSDDHIVLITV